MSIMVNGTLSVQRISGTHGEFSVGKLECQLGVLNIKDPQLDQYETGKYPGRFGIEKIYPHGYMARTGCFIVEVRAVLNEYIIHSDEPDVLDTEVALKETDPLDAPQERKAEPSPPVVPPPNENPVVRPQTPKPVSTPPPRQKVSPLNTPLPGELKQNPSTAQEHGVDADPMIALFGELWPLGNVVKLDPTSIRSDAENHRKRCNYLVLQGYKFKASSQSFERVVEDTLL